MVVEVSLSDNFFGDVASVLVVGGYEHQAVCLHIINSEFHAFIVASMGLCNCDPDWRFDTVLFRELSFFVHVSTSDQLKS